MDQERMVTVEHDGEQCLTPVEEVAVDDIIIVYPGDQIPDRRRDTGRSGNGRSASGHG